MKMTKKEFMRKENVKTERTVDKWVQKQLIPGVKTIESTGELYFPPSARRPYFPPWNLKKDQDSIRGSIVKACLKNTCFTHTTFAITEDEFNSYICQLMKADLIESVIYDGIVYYNSTLQSSAWKQCTTAQRNKYVLQALKTTSDVVAIVANVLAVCGALS